MSFKLEIEILDDLTTKVNFDGTINHIVLLGVLESIKHGVLVTTDAMAMNDAMIGGETHEEEVEE